MKTVIFDGRAFVAKKEKELKKKVGGLKKRDVTPKLVAVYVGDNPASEIYLKKKRMMANRVGCELEILRFNRDVCIDELIHRYKELNSDRSINGIMLQLPLPDKFSHEDRDKIINSIAKERDVDGMRNDSPFLAPVVKAVIYALKEASVVPPLRVRPCKVAPLKVVVVGHTGFEGRKIYRALKEMGYEVVGVDKRTKNLKEKTISADIIISVTGVSGLIKQSMVKEGCVLIDVGAPDGDIERGAYKKASFVSPVPGGIGPVTIISLLENIVEACV